MAVPFQTFCVSPSPRGDVKEIPQIPTNIATYQSVCGPIRVMFDGCIHRELPTQQSKQAAVQTSRKIEQILYTIYEK